jgi:hypothetical protein
MHMCMCMYVALTHAHRLHHFSSVPFRLPILTIRSRNATTPFPAPSHHPFLPPRPFPLIGERPRADEKERRLRANVEKKLVGDRVLSASAMKVLMMRAGPAFKTEDVRTGGGGGASAGDSDLEDLIDDLM